ncbi:MAG TPA: ABC transporter ATP-binding protein [Candidatus Binatia bacterium]|jgi:ABC-type multidrug transport system fused ATPase/permease subunit|nr:ABC transporter ATP-binding protein [Candidatus Binatia bacterium]
MKEQVGGRITNSETLLLFRRALCYVAPFKWQFMVKVGLMILSLTPLLLLPWPIKILIDHVVGRIPIGEKVAAYPFFVRPLLEPLRDASPTEVLFWVVAAQTLLLVVIGAFGLDDSERTGTGAKLSDGQDTATTTENAANAGFSPAGGLLGLFEFHWTLRLTQAFNHYYRSRLFARIQSLPMTAFDDERIGDAVYRVMYDTPAITEVSYWLLLAPVVNPLGILLTVWVLSLSFGDHPFLVWSALAFLPIALISTYPFAAALRHRGERSREAGATTTSTVEEGINNILAVQSLGGQRREHERFAGDSWAAFTRYRRYLLVGIGAFLAATVPGLFILTRAYFYVMNLAIEEKISLGDVMLLFSYFMIVLSYAGDLGTLWIRVQNSAAGLHRVFFLMDLAVEENPANAGPLAPVREGIQIEDVHFAYDGKPVLQGVNFTARLGQVTALVGPAGAGKTTLASLVPRFLGPQSGRVLIDGVDIAGVTRQSLRAQIAFVFQENILFDGTIEDNIRVGKLDASEAEVQRAAEVSGAEEFIQKLPQGYQTPLGRAGAKLSVGQKQRLALARALVRDAPILILDEPTSALDPETERSFLARLREVSQTRLVLVITHRYSTAAAADQILFLDDGRIVEHGHPDDLLSRPGGAYRRYFDLQTRGWIRSEQDDNKVEAAAS